MCVHLVQAGGHDEEGCRSLVSTWRGRGGQVVTLQDVLILRLPFMELVILPTDSGHFEHVAQDLTR